MRKQKASSKTRADVSLRRSFEEYYGIASRVKDFKPDDSVLDLFTPVLVREFARRLINDHHCKRTSVVARMGPMINALRRHRRFRDMDFSWVREVLSEFRIEDPEELRRRRRTSEVDYGSLNSMLEQMTSERRALNNPSIEELAWRVHDELLVLWLTTFPWPPRCIREARLGSDRNIFKLPAPDGKTTGIPPWALAERDLNPEATFWQFRFGPSETSNAQEECGFLPRRLLPLLDEYLSVHREHLVGSSDPGTLFLDRFGGSMGILALVQRVGILTERYLQRKVTPTAVRAIFAYNWLQQKPRDYAALGGILWMDSPSVKIRFDPQYRRGRRHA
jgi:hypothetical protein